MSAQMLLMYKENNKGPRTLPRGTPDTTGPQSDLIPFTLNLSCLEQRKKKSVVKSISILSILRNLFHIHIIHNSL